MLWLVRCNEWRYARDRESCCPSELWIIEKTSSARGKRAISPTSVESLKCQQQHQNHTNKNFRNKTLLISATIPNEENNQQTIFLINKLRSIVKIMALKKNAYTNALRHKVSIIKPLRLQLRACFTHERTLPEPSCNTGPLIRCSRSRCSGSKDIGRGRYILSKPAKLPTTSTVTGYNEGWRYQQSYSRETHTYEAHVSRVLEVLSRLPSRTPVHETPRNQ